MEGLVCCQLRTRADRASLDVDFPAGEIRQCRGIVRQHVGRMKTGSSRKPVPMDAGPADVLTRWRNVTPYKQDGDYMERVARLTQR